MTENKPLPNSAKELRHLYKCSSTTWTQWLKPLIEAEKIRPYAKIYTPKELNEIIKHLDPPH